MVKISYLEITARPDYPYPGRPELHLWEPTLQTLAKQTFTDFEYIVIDVFYEERSHWFEEDNRGLRIKHIPSGPSVWKDLGICHTVHQFNKGMIHADGELIFMGADSAMYPPQLMDRVWSRYREGWFISAGFGADLTYLEEAEQRKIFRAQNVLGDPKNPYRETPPVIPTYWYRSTGFEGKVVMDHRYVHLFADGDGDLVPISGQWYFGIGSLSMEAALEVNGMDEDFNSTLAMSDIDLGYRLDMAGYKLAMDRDVYTVEAYAGRGWHSGMRQPRPEVVCCYALFKRNLLLEMYRVNQSGPVPPGEEIDTWFIRNVCEKVCEIRERCREKCTYRAPFYNKHEPDLYRVWKREAETRIDLGLEREMRISGEEYQEGTMVNV